VKVAADGKGPGLPVILFGDFKNEHARDVPINDRSGKHIAELVSTGNRPCVIGLRGWTQGGDDALLDRLRVDALRAPTPASCTWSATSSTTSRPRGKILSPPGGHRRCTGRTGCCPKGAGWGWSA
jgi:hypothetical protein